MALDYDLEANMLFSDSFGAPGPADQMMPADPGLGLQTQDPAPVVDRSVPEFGRDGMSERDRFLSSLTPMQRFGRTLQNFSRGMEGKPSIEEEEQKRLQKERLIKLQEVKLFAEAAKDALDTADQLTGDARTQFIETKARMLGAVSPDAAELLRTFAANPKDYKMILEQAEKSPSLKRALESGGLKAARALLSTSEGNKLVKGEIESGMLPAIVKKLNSLGLAAQELMTPERHKKMMDDGVISPAEARELNEAAKSHPKYKKIALSEQDFELASRYEDATYGHAGFSTTKTAQEIMKQRARDNKAQSEIGKIRADIDAGRITRAEGEAKIAKMTKQGGDGDTRLMPATISVNGRNIAALVDKFGNYYDANTRQRIQGGIGPQISEADERRGRELAGKAEGLQNLTKAVDALEKIVKNNPRSAAGLFSGPARGIEYVAGSLNPGGKGAAPGTQAVQLRDSILQSMGNLTRMSNADRERIENALQVGSGGNPRNLPLAIELLRDHIKKEQAQIDAPRPRGKGEGGKKKPEEMSDDELIKALGGG